MLKSYSLYSAKNLLLIKQADALSSRTKSRCRLESLPKLNVSQTNVVNKIEELASKPVFT
jgi:hypothetical protein